MEKRVLLSKRLLPLQLQTYLLTRLTVTLEHWSHWTKDSAAGFLQVFMGLIRSLSPVQQVQALLVEMEVVFPETTEVGKHEQDDAGRGIFVVTVLKKNLLGQSHVSDPLTDSHMQLAASFSTGQFCLLAKYMESEMQQLQTLNAL